MFLPWEVKGWERIIADLLCSLDKTDELLELPGGHAGVLLGLRVSGTALLLLGRGLLGLAGALLEAEQLGEVSKLLGEHVHMSESGAGWNVEAVAVCDSSGSTNILPDYSLQGCSFLAIARLWKCFLLLL